MKFGIVSDIHLGDPNCSLITEENGNYVPGKKYEEFKTKLGEGNDYLIVVGDIIDLSIVSYGEAFSAAKAFFTEIQKDMLAKNIIYVPGNHDFDLWHTVEHQINIIRQLREGKPARGFKWSVPGLIDDREGSPSRGFQLPGTTDIIDPDKFEGEPLFINSITKAGPDKGKPTHFYFAYPNLYIVTDSESVLVTHGHYLEQYWTMTCEWAMKIAREDLRIGDALDIREMVAVNFPTCQLACTGVGQAGPLTKVVQEVQRKVKDQEFKKVDDYIDRFDAEIDKLNAYGFFDPREWATDAISNLIKKKIKEKLRQFKDTRYSDEFIDKPEVRSRFRRYYESSRIEISDLGANSISSIPAIPAPHKFIIGHTHRPFPWSAGLDLEQKTPDGKPMMMFNTGGWLFKKTGTGERAFCGAEIFIYETGKGFISRSVKDDE